MVEKESKEIAGEVTDIPVGLLPFLHLCPSSALRKAAGLIPEAYWDLSEDAFDRLVRPTKVDRALRASLVTLFNVGARTGKPFGSSKIYEGICSNCHWYIGVLKRPEKLSWILRPILVPNVQVEALKIVAVNRLRDILDAPLLKENGELSLKSVRSVLRVVAILLPPKTTTKV